MGMWTNIRDQLPPMHQPVLACFMLRFHDGTYGKHVAIGCYSDSPGFLTVATDDHMINLLPSYIVDAPFWMPLPKITKEMKEYTFGMPNVYEKQSVN